MDYKFWFPTIINAIGVWLAYRMLELMKQQQNPAWPSANYSLVRKYWPLLVMLALMAVTWIPYLTHPAPYKFAYTWNQNSKFEEVSHRKFVNERVVLDGRHFADCTFTNVTFVYNGTAPIAMEHNTFSGWTFESENDAVFDTVALLKGLGALSSGSLLTVGPEHRSLDDQIKAPGALNQKSQ